MSEGRASQRAGTKLVDVYYDISGGTPPYTVTLEGSADGGATWNLPLENLEGAVGSGVNAGSNRRVTWDAGSDWSGEYSDQVRFRIIVDGGDPSAGLVAYYRFDGDALDASGNERHGSLHNGAAYGPGKHGQGLVLDGQDDYFASQYPLPPAFPFTWACWLKPAFDFATGVEQSYPVNGGGEVGKRGITPWIIITKDHPELGNATVAVGVYAYGDPNYATSAPLDWQADEWHHVAFTADSSQMKLFLDGKLAASVDDPTFPDQAHPPVKLYVGGNAAYLTLVPLDRLGFFRGTIDDVRIYDDVLTASEIEQITKP